MSAEAVPNGMVKVSELDGKAPDSTGEMRFSVGSSILR